MDHYLRGINVTVMFFSPPSLHPLEIHAEFMGERKECLGFSLKYSSTVPLKFGLQINASLQIVCCLR